MQPLGDHAAPVSSTLGGHTGALTNPPPQALWTALCSGAGSRHGRPPQPLGGVPTHPPQVPRAAGTSPEGTGDESSSRAGGKRRGRQRSKGKRWWERPSPRGSGRRTTGSGCRASPAYAHRPLLPGVPSPAHRYCFINRTRPQWTSHSTTNSSPSAHLKHTIN